MGKSSAVITQNIDGLHQAAGLKNIIEFHRTIYKNYCVKCPREYTIDYLLQSKGISHCECSHTVTL
jgi:NAD-dependent deacetylase